MAIQVWDEQAQQYRGVELARYGPSGTLAEALVWVNGEYKRVWPVGPTVPTPLWTDDFTSPTLHERWTLMAGDYTPPGFHGQASGPLAGPDFDLTATTSGNDLTLGILNLTTFEGVMFSLNPGGDPTFADMLGAHFSFAANTSGQSVTIRRQSGQWSLLLDGELAVGTEHMSGAESVYLTAPDPFGSADLPILIAGGANSPMTSVSYTEL